MMNDTTLLVWSFVVRVLNIHSHFVIRILKGSFVRIFLFVALSLLLVNLAHAADKVRVQLNWVPEPEFGGIYQAQQDGAFATHGLDVDITPGGAGAPTWQLVGTGKVDFALASADEVLIARQQQADVVAIFATYQTCPQGIMVHASRGLKSVADLFKAGGTLAVEPGLPYVNFLKKKYGDSKINFVSYDGGPANFLHDPNFAQQCFVTSEPIAAQKAGSDPQVFLIADTGYNPYTTVIITRGDYIKSHPDQVKAMTAALRDGWEAYLADPSKANAVMEKLNPDMDAPTFAAAAAAQKPLIQTDQTKRDGLGTMTLERWKTLASQLKDLGVITTANPTECFINPTR
jgi:NitT/TauT family transport system substrate-binding protein